MKVVEEKRGGDTFVTDGHGVRVCRATAKTKMLIKSIIAAGVGDKNTVMHTFYMQRVSSVGEKMSPQSLATCVFIDSEKSDFAVVDVVSVSAQCFINER